MEAYASDILFSPRDETQCIIGRQFYRCASNDFRGCCSVDPCDLNDCPDVPVSILPFPSETKQAPTETRALIITAPATTATQTSTTEEEAEGETSTTEEVEEQTTTMTTTEETSTIGDYATETTLITSSDRDPTTLMTTIRHTSSDIASNSLSDTITSNPSTTAEFDLNDQPTETSTSSNTQDEGGNSSARIGGIAGGVIGGLFLIFLIWAIYYTRRKQKKSRQAHSLVSSAAEGGGIGGGVGMNSEKGSPNNLSPSTVGSPSGADPFAAFGGRDDGTKAMTAVENDDGLHEMDGATNEIRAELPAQGPYSLLPSRDGGSPMPVDKRRRDPRATLNGTVNDEGRPAYVNHWSQYRG